MARLKKRLNGHTILCGFGYVGRSVAGEWCKLGGDPKDLVVIERDGDSAQEAAEEGFVALHGDATRELMLQAAAVEKAENLIAATGRDDTNILISLTARSLQPDVYVIARANEEENIKLMRSSGCQSVVTPAHAGGNLMALATRRTGLVRVLEDIMTRGGSLQLDEREPLPEEVGKAPKTIAGMVIMGVVRDGEQLPLRRLDDIEIEGKDRLVTLVESTYEQPEKKPRRRQVREPGAKRRRPRRRGKGGSQPDDDGKVKK